jgi:hypothetical protein
MREGIGGVEEEPNPQSKVAFAVAICAPRVRTENRCAATNQPAILIASSSQRQSRPSIQKNTSSFVPSYQPFCHDASVNRTKDHPFPQNCLACHPIPIIFGSQAKGTTKNGNRPLNAQEIDKGASPLPAVQPIPVSATASLHPEIKSAICKYYIE